MTHTTLLQLSSILLAGTAAQWVAWRCKLPSIVLLLVVGFFLGPVTQFIKPDALFGDLLFPLVSLSVAVILFEGGLTLKFQELSQIGPVVIRLITLGALTTWFGIAVVGYLILDLPWKLALLLGAILIVTGPTVVGPLLRHVRPKEKLSSVLRWEGIVTDPLGAICAFLVFETILAGTFEQAPLLIALGVMKSVLIGCLAGYIGARGTVYALKRYLIPDHLQGSASLSMVVLTFMISDMMYPESGLLATTVMGIVLANQNEVAIKHLIEFKEHLQVLLISALFIVLSARVKPEELYALNTQSFLFVLGAIFIVRPAAILVSVLGSREFSLKESLFLSWIAPRGIVAAAVASVFSLKLTNAGYPAAEKIVSITFLIIVSTALVYGLTALPLARMLGVKEERPKGLLIIGANRFCRSVAKELQGCGVYTILFDTNQRNVHKARQLGLKAHYGNILSETFLSSIDLSRLGTVLALTESDETNSLAVIRLSEIFGKSEVYQLPNAPTANDAKETGSPLELTGRLLFTSDITFDAVEQMLDEGFEVGSRVLSKEFTFQDLMQQHTEDLLPLAVLPSEGKVEVARADDTQSPKSGDTVIYFSRT